MWQPVISDMVMLRGIETIQARMRCMRASVHVRRATDNSRDGLLVAGASPRPPDEMIDYPPPWVITHTVHLKSLSRDSYASSGPMLHQRIRLIAPPN